MQLCDFIGMQVTLEIKRRLPQGFYLGFKDSDETVLLPNIYISDLDNIEDEKDVFLYTDSEDRMIATTLVPKAYISNIAILEIKDIVKNGVFLDLGIAKDIFMPTKTPFLYKDAKELAVIITKDKQNRLIAKKDISGHIKKCNDESLLHKKVEIFTIGMSDLGIACLVLPEFFQGLIYKNEIFVDIKINTRYFATIKNIREDGKLDLQLVHNMDNLHNLIKDLSSKNEYFNIKDLVGKDIGLSNKAIKRELSALITSGELLFVKDRGYKVKKLD